MKVFYICLYCPKRFPLALLLNLVVYKTNILSYFVFLKIYNVGIFYKIFNYIKHPVKTEALARW